MKRKAQRMMDRSAIKHNEQMLRYIAYFLEHYDDLAIDSCENGETHSAAFGDSSHTREPKGRNVMRWHNE